jgi:hypothetical protein
VLFPSLELAQAYSQKFYPEASAPVTAAPLKVDAVAFQGKFAEKIQAYGQAVSKEQAARTSKEKSTATALKEKLAKELSGGLSKAIAPAVCSVYEQGNLASLLTYFRKADFLKGIELPNEFLVKAYSTVISHLFSNSSDAPLSLSKEDAVALFVFARDLVITGATGGLEKLEILEDVKVSDVVLEFCAALVKDFNTHSAKSSHASATFTATLSNPACELGYFNGRELPAVVSGSTGGGKLSTAPFLLSVLTASLEFEGRVIPLLSCLTDVSLREFFAEHQITVFDAFPPVALMSPAYSPLQVPVVKFRVDEESSVALAIVPSHALLAGLNKLSASVHAYQQEENQKSLEAVLAQVQTSYAFSDIEIDKVRKGFSVQKDERDLGELADALNTRGRTRITVAQLAEAANQLKYVQGKLSRSPIVKSNPQNVSAIYQKVAGVRGLPRFKAYLANPSGSVKPVRQTHALDALFAKKLGRVVERQVKRVSLTDKYRVGSAWLPNRVQAAMATTRVKYAVETIMGILAELQNIFAGLHPDELAMCQMVAASPIQKLVVQSVALTDAEKEFFAERALPALRSLAADDQAAFKTALLERL